MRVLLEADKISADERRTCMREMKDCQQRLWRMKTADDDETGTHARQPAELVAQCLNSFVKHANTRFFCLKNMFAVPCGQQENYWPWRQPISQ